MAKRKQTARWGLWLGFLVLIAAVGWYGWQGRTPSPAPEAPSYSVEKSGAAVTLDFVPMAQRLHQSVDGALQKHGLQVQDKQEANKEVARQKVEGSIRWHARQLFLQPKADWSGERVQQALKEALAGSGGEVLAVQAEQIKGQTLQRLDIGRKETVEGDTITIITDRVYVPAPKGSTAAQTPATNGTLNTPPLANGRGKLAIVIDDFGYTHDAIGAFANMGRPITMAVIPYRPYSKDAAARGNGAGQQVILHLPMEPLDHSAQSEDTAIQVAMSDGEIQDTVRRALQAVPGVIGMNNHQGSRATADKRVMRQVVQVAREQGLFFLDSRTNSQSVASDVAQQYGVATGDNHLFLDNQDDVGYVKNKLRSAQQLALQHGSAIVIGHARMNTATAVREMIPELEAHGVQLVFASQLLR